MIAGVIHGGGAGRSRCAYTGHPIQHKGDRGRIGTTIAPLEAKVNAAAVGNHPIPRRITNLYIATILGNQTTPEIRDGLVTGKGPG